jgi:uncharacterized protein
MSELSVQLMADLKESMKQKDKLRKGVITMIRSEMISMEKEHGDHLTQDDEIGVLNRELKKNRDALEEFKKADRQDLVEETERKIEIILGYLPKQMTEDEIRQYIASTTIDMNAPIGKLISLFNSNLKGRAPGQLITKVVKEWFQG